MVLFISWRSEGMGLGSSLYTFSAYVLPVKTGRSILSNQSLYPTGMKEDST